MRDRQQRIFPERLPTSEEIREQVKAKLFDFQIREVLETSIGKEMGMAAVACSQARVHPTRYLLEEMRASASLEAAAARLEDWLDTVRALKKRKTRGGEA